MNLKEHAPVVHATVPIDLVVAVPTQSPTLLDYLSRFTGIHPALYKLIGLQGRSTLRRMTRGGKSPGRIIVFLIGALLCIGWLASALLSLSTRSDPNKVRAMMPLALLGICVVSAVTSFGDKAIAFTPGEVDQLFPGPFTRRELLAYKLIKSGLAAILTAIVLSVVLLKHARWWPACFVGVFLSLLFVQWFSILLLLGSQAIGVAIYSRLQRLIVVAAVILLVYAAKGFATLGIRGGEAALYQFHDTALGRVLLAPFDPFGQLMTSSTTSQILKWSFLAAILNGGLLILLFLLDSYYVETAMGASERRYAKIQRVRTGSFLSVGVSKTAGWQLPQLPWAGGAGPIVWRQLTSAARSSRGLLLLLLIVAIGVAPVLSIAGHGGKVIELLLSVMAWITFLCSSMLNFDFRGDIDHIESLKALPLRAWAVGAGQVIVPALLLTMFHLLLLCIASFVVHERREILFATMFLVLPFNMLLFAAENLMFLLFPSRPAAVSPGDFQVLGRKFIFLIAKMLILGAAVFVAALPAVFCWQLADKNVAVGTAVAWVVLATEAVAMVPIIAWAYRRFDPSLHTPV